MIIYSLDVLFFLFGTSSYLKPVHPKGDQSWVFIGRTDAKAETPILWPLSAIRVVSSAYLRLFLFLPEILIPSCA